MKNIFFILLIAICLNLQATEPKYSISAKGNVTDIVFNNNVLFIASDAGIVELYDIAKKDFIKTISLPSITDFYGDKLLPKIYDIDYNSEKKELLIISQAKGGFSNLHIYDEKNGLRRVISPDEKMMIKKAVYLNNKEILLGLLSNEIIKFNLEKQSILYRIQVSSYTFSDFALSQKKGRLISSDESGRVNILRTDNGKVLTKHKGENLDNVYQIDYKGKTIATAGQDRKLGIYHFRPFTSYSIQSEFLIYSVGLSPKGEKVAYAANERNELRVVDTYTQKEIAIKCKCSVNFK